MLEVENVDDVSLAEELVYRLDEAGVSPATWLRTRRGRMSE
jgi:hypothetical protein